VIKVLYDIYNHLLNSNISRIYEAEKTSEGISQITNIIKYFRLLKLAKNPLDIWNLFVSNTSDAQTIIPFIKEESYDPFLCFTGMPYYKTSYIDSIYMDISYDSIAENTHNSNLKIKKAVQKTVKNIIEQLTNIRMINYLLMNEPFR
jgi:hypothetical protein